MASLALLARVLVLVLWAIVLGRVVMSWIDPRSRTFLGRSLEVITEPILAPVRSVLPRTGGLDLSPFLVLLVLSLFASRLI